MIDMAMQALWVNPQQAGVSLKQQIVPWAKPLLITGHHLVVNIRLAEDAKTDRQRKFYHGVILKEVAQQARPNGVNFPMAVWKEHFRQQFLGFKTVTTTNPLTGKKSRRRVRISTEDLGVKAYSELIDRVCAFAATELGVEFSSTRWQDYVDPETGEIVGGLA